MFVLTQPRLLVWVHERWQVLTPKQYFALSNSAASTSFNEALDQLKSLTLPSQKVDAVILSSNWLISGQKCLPDHFPISLYTTAAHTYGAEISPLSDEQRTTSSIAVRTPGGIRLCYAVLPESDFSALLQKISCSIFVDELIKQANISNWRTLKQQMAPFERYRVDSFEQRSEALKIKRQCLTMGVLACVGLGVGGYLYWQTPPEPDLREVNPWQGSAPQIPSLIESFRYLHTLPRNVRLDEVDVTESSVRVTLTGSSNQLQVWQDNWPAHLPPLVTTVQ